MIKELNIEYKQKQDEVIIEGVRYSGEFFRSLSKDGISIGEPFVILKRRDGILTIKSIKEEISKI